MGGQSGPAWGRASHGQTSSQEPLPPAPQPGLPGFTLFTARDAVGDGSVRISGQPPTCGRWPSRCPFPPPPLPSLWPSQKAPVGGHQPPIVGCVCWELVGAASFLQRGSVPAARGPQRPMAQFPRMQGWLGTQLGPSSVLMPAPCPALRPTVTSALPVPALAAPTGPGHESHVSLRGSCMSTQPMGTWGPRGALPPTTGPRCVDICADGPRGGRRRPGLWPDSQSPFMRGNLAPKTTGVAPQTRGARGACPAVLFLQGLLAPGQVQGQPS